MTCRVHSYTKEQLDEHGLTRETFITKRIKDIKKLSVILGRLNNHLSDDEELRYISRTIETILNDQEDILYGVISNYITFESHIPA